MRFLKNKILMAKEAYERNLNNNPNTSMQSPVLSDEPTIASPVLKSKFVPMSHQNMYIDEPEQLEKSARNKPKTHAPKVVSSTKNMSINYGQSEVSLKEFILFVSKAKNKIGGITSFRSLLLIDEKVDSVKTMMLKKIFKMISEVFIKYFSVNWIIHGKVTHKLVYLKFRSKMLRRVQNPELFTYVRKRESKLSKTAV